MPVPLSLVGSEYMLLVVWQRSYWRADHDANANHDSFNLFKIHCSSIKYRSVPVQYSISTGTTNPRHSLPPTAYHQLSFWECNIRTNRPIITSWTEHNSKIFYTPTKLPKRDVVVLTSFSVPIFFPLDARCKRAVFRQIPSRLAKSFHYHGAIEFHNDGNETS